MKRIFLEDIQTNLENNFNRWSVRIQRRWKPFGKKTAVSDNIVIINKTTYSDKNALFIYECISEL